MATRHQIPFSEVVMFQHFFLYGHEYVKYSDTKAMWCESKRLCLCDSDNIVEVDEIQKQ